MSLEEMIAKNFDRINQKELKRKVYWDQVNELRKEFNISLKAESVLEFDLIEPSYYNINGEKSEETDFTVLFPFDDIITNRYWKINYTFDQLPKEERMKILSTLFGKADKKGYSINGLIRENEIIIEERACCTWNNEKTFVQSFYFQYELCEL